jgi:hypothetical protein
MTLNLEAMKALVTASAAGQLLMHHPRGGTRCASHLFGHDQGVVIVEDSWMAAYPSGNFNVRLIEGRVRREGNRWLVDLTTGPPGTAEFVRLDPATRAGLPVVPLPPGDRTRAFELACGIYPGTWDAHGG